MEQEQFLNQKEEPPSGKQTQTTSLEVITLKNQSPTTKSSKATLSEKRKSTITNKQNEENNDGTINIVNSLLFPISPKVQAFRKKYYPKITNVQWNDWHWQVSSRIRTIEDLERIVTLSENEKSGILAHKGPLPFAITPYYASLIEGSDENQPIRRTVIMVKDEELLSPGESDDPLNEDGDSPVPGIVHRYPDRVLFLATGFCSVYCRYCTRSRMVGNPGGEYKYNLPQWENAIKYISEHPEIRDVLISGGDPLTLSDEKIEWLLSNLRKIPHVEFIRMGTKVPAVLPQRITPSLTKILKKYHPLWLSVHFTHPDELTPEVQEACSRLADAGIPLGSQTVLLKGVNDSVDILKPLYHGLLKIRVKPYYLYQCDPVAGTAHFRTPIAKGLEMIAGLRGHTTGYAVPSYIVDSPGGGGKIPLLPEYYQGREGNYVLLKNYEGEIFKYYDEAIEETDKK
ncbi:MAG: KamA family radical SAM protein [Ignavibacteriales bacterium]|nr:KamA family radical SAM protein [Ignavibacteriota bacterium]MCB9249065.1 KamA family radical SAM protein [Ignavibacteriales bacterium]